MGKRITCRIAVLAAVWMMICCTGCTSLKDIRNIRIESFNIKSLSIKGLDSVEAIASVSVDNPAKDISVSGIDGTLYKSGKNLGTFTIAPFEIGGRGLDTATVSCSLKLSPDLSPLALMSLARDFDISDCTMDVNARARIGKSPWKKFELKDIPVKNIINSL